jgi:hypothetical protein
MARKSRQVETRLIAEYLKKHYSKLPFIMKQPLGSVSEELLKTKGYKYALGVTRPFRPEVDAVVIFPDRLVIIEAKVWSIINGLAKLPLYKSLVPVTPELKQYMPREVLMELVVGWTNPNLERMAREMGVKVRLYCPDWLKEVVEDMHHYWTKEYQQERQKKLRMREYFGVE